MADDPDAVAYEFLAEIVRVPVRGGDSVRFRYVQDEITEITISADWWESLERPEYLNVRAEADRQELDTGRYHE